MPPRPLLVKELRDDEVRALRNVAKLLVPAAWDAPREPGRPEGASRWRAIPPTEGAPRRTIAFALCWRLPQRPEGYYEADARELQPESALLLEDAATGEFAIAAAALEGNWATRLARAFVRLGAAPPFDLVRELVHEKPPPAPEAWDLVLALAIKRVCQKAIDEFAAVTFAATDYARETENELPNE